MENNKNLIIGLLLIVVVLLLAFLVLRPIMYGSTYGPNAYPPGRMGPGMMNNPGYNYSYGPGMMGGVMGDMMALYYPEAKPITQDVALKNMQNFARQYGSNIVV